MAATVGGESGVGSRESGVGSKNLSIHLILYSKPGCHLCEGLQEKLTQIQSLDLELEVRDIMTRDDWLQAYQYEIPVLVLVREKGERRQEAEGVGGAEAAEAAGGDGDLTQALELKTQNSKLHPSSLFPLPRPSPRATVPQLEQMLRRYLQ